MPDDFDLATFLPYRLAVLSERVSRRLEVEYAKTHGLSVAEWRVMVHLLRGGKVSVRDIQVHVNLEKSRVSRAVSRLEDRGLVAKASGGDDARLVEITLTQAGHDALDHIIPLAEGIEAGLLAALSIEEIEALSATMEKLHAKLDADPEARPRLAADLVTKPG